jgi:hypothetical protein
MLQRNATNSSYSPVPGTPTAWDTAVREFRELTDRMAAGELQCEAAAGVLGALHQALLQDAPAYRSTVEEMLAAPSRPAGSGWSWSVLVDNPLLRCGLLGVYAGYPIPAHDHPGSQGALLVLTGKLRVSWYAVRRRLPGDLIELHTVAQRDFDVGDAALIDTEDRNIHQVVALTERCLTLNLLVPPFTETQRSWYLPIIDTEPGVMVARRLSANALLRATAQ